MAQRRRLLAVVVVLLALVACEAALQVGSLTSRTIRRVLMAPWERARLTVPDERLGVRGNPDIDDHDVAGYRNPVRPARAPVVVLGDSHAYGAGIAAPWPSRLGAYNMGVPGYGPGHSLLQLDEALALAPQQLIVVPYLGNDLLETYALTRRHPGLLDGVDPELLRAAHEVTARGDIDAEAQRLFAIGFTPTTLSDPRAWLSRHMKLYALVRALRARLAPTPTTSDVISRDFQRAQQALTAAQRQHVIPVEVGDWRTLLTPAYRRLTVDARDPRVQVGLQVALAALRQLDVRAREAGVAVLVVVLPTKESVFWPRVGDTVPGLAALVADEARIRQGLVTALQASDIAVVDALPALQAAPSQPYFEDIDGHPNEVGHAVIAALVAEALQRSTGSRRAL
jgi:hypothetical protein